MDGPIKRCRVCADLATGFNFNGLSCESCKAFFRRNAFKLSDLHCRQSTGRCSINLLNRRYCRHCRLKLCFAIGMKKELIHAPKSTAISLISSPLSQSTLQPYECAHYTEIEKAFSVYVDETTLEVIGPLQTASGILNCPGQYIGLTIKFCKRLAAFKSLSPDDQLTLLKPFFAEKTSLSISFKYDAAIDGWTGLENETSSRVHLVLIDRMRALWSRRIHQQMLGLFQAFIQSLHGELEGDATLCHLLQVVLLFKPRAELSRPETVAFYHTFYSYLLKRYLENKYRSQTVAEKKYGSLMALLRKIDYVAGVVRQLYLEMVRKKDECQLMEGLEEIFDLGAAKGEVV